jgi:hypothetical protein
MTTYREEKKYSACSYKSVANSNLYLPGPPCLQPTFERTKFDMDMMKMYNPNSTTTNYVVAPQINSSTSSTISENYKLRRGCNCGK